MHCCWCVLSTARRKSTSGQYLTTPLPCGTHWVIYVECKYPVDLPEHAPSCHQGNMPTKPARIRNRTGDLMVTNGEWYHYTKVPAGDCAPLITANDNVNVFTAQLPGLYQQSGHDGHCKQVSSQEMHYELPRTYQTRWLTSRIQSRATAAAPPWE